MHSWIASLQIGRHLIEVDIVPCSLIKQQNGRVLEEKIIHKIYWSIEKIKAIGSIEATLQETPYLNFQCSLNFAMERDGMLIKLILIPSHCKIKGTVKLTNYMI